eukprot:364428-Chlamydomonas_euryale.AAC.10
MEVWKCGKVDLARDEAGNLRFKVGIGLPSVQVPAASEASACRLLRLVTSREASACRLLRLVGSREASACRLLRLVWSREASACRLLRLVACREASACCLFRLAAFWSANPRRTLNSSPGPVACSSSNGPDAWADRCLLPGPFSTAAFTLLHLLARAPNRYVLQDFSKKEAEAMEFAVLDAIDVVRRALADGVDAAVAAGVAR